ncbi:MAG: hypothetical protein O2871_03255 [bacterium]|nr:hypothetical protein [bacterium]
MKYHKNLKEQDWFKLTLVTQMANIGSEAIRAVNWKTKGNDEYSELALFRALELLNLTKSDVKNKKRLKEVTRIYELLVDFFKGENIYKTTPTFIINYFTQFTYLNAVKNEK